MSARPGAALVALLALTAGCVDTGTGTGGDTSGNGVASTDPSGSWNATQYTLTSASDASKSVDYVQQGYTPTIVITSTDLTASVKFAIGGDGFGGKISYVGSDLTLKASDSTVIATGTFSRSGNQMTLDLSGKGIVHDFDHTGVAAPALLHASLVQLAH